MKKPELYIRGKLNHIVNEYAHLSHIISDSMDDKHYILYRRNMPCGKINNVLCFFCQQNPAVKLNLMCHYCSDHYGSALWNLNNPTIEDVCIAWHEGLRRSYDLPRCTHSLFVPAICGLLPIKYELVVLLRFQTLCRRSVSVGFARKTSVFGSVSVLIINAL